MAETGDFTKWPVPQPLFGADALDGPSDSLYTNAYTRYPGADLHLMFPTVFHQVADYTDIQLAVSSDGRTWSRPSREPIVPCGESESEEGGGVYVDPALFVLPDGRFAIPYTARASRHHESYYGLESRAARVRLAMWPEHRLGGMRADSRGAFTLESRSIGGGQLALNYRTDRGGWIRAALYENIPHPPQPVDPLPGYSFNQCEPLAGDQLRAPLRWNDADLSSLSGRKINVRFELNRGTIFAFELGAATDERHSI